MDELKGREKKKILVVEDNLEILELTLEMLSLKGYAVEKAEDGQKGLILAKAQIPDLIISDIMMPNMDGHDFLKALRADDKTAMIPFIFMTAKAQKSDILQGAVSGADRYLTKPVSMAVLLKTIQGVLI